MINQNLEIIKTYRFLFILDSTLDFFKYRFVNYVQIKNHTKYIHS